MKKKLSDIFGITCILAILAGCVEAPDGGPTMWTVYCLAVALVAGLLSKKMEGAK
jgi:hypothetical protein